MSEPLRMSAYYYSFKPTGNEAIDRILSAVACAGKAFHHTRDWCDETTGEIYEGHTGTSPVEWIQNAADDAARTIPVPRETLERLREALRELVRVMSHQLARGEDPEEGAFDRAWVAACAALSDEEPAPESPMAAAARALREKGEQEKAQQESRHCCRGAFLCDKHWPGEKP